MAPMDESWMEELQAMFRVEGIEHLKSMSSGLMELEGGKCADIQAVKECVYREAHSLKGAARSIGLTEIEQVCQSIEDVLSAYKQDCLQLTPAHFDVIHGTLDTVELHIREQQPLEVGACVETIRQIMPDKLAEDPGSAAPKASAVLQPSVTRETLHKKRIETLNLPVERMDRLMERAESLLGSRLAMDQLVDDLKLLYMDVGQWKEELESRARFNGRGHEGHDNDHDLVVFHESVTDRLLLFESGLSRIAQMADSEARRLTGRVNQLVDSVKSTLMLPFDHLLKMMPKIVRDVAHTQGKRVNIVQEGGHIEVDRRILEALKDPLIHLLRNSVDHGVEAPEVRLAAGKEAVGQIGLTISPSDQGHVEIRLWDDGQGIDADAVRAAAVRKGLIDENSAAALSDSEARELIFLSEMTTSPTVNVLSGRGLGLAIVQEKVDALGGSLILESTPGQGTVFRLVMPIKQANFRGIVVTCSGQTLVLPTHNVVRSGRVRPEELLVVEGQKTLLEAGRHLPYHDLSTILGLTEDTGPAETRQFQQLVVVQAQGTQLAFGVDDVIREQEILVKPLGEQLVRVRNVSGATILGNGCVAPILNSSDLILTAQKQTMMTRQKNQIREHGERKAILVAEDSITTRTLLKRILSGAGYSVTTAVDGMDAISKLYARGFDLLVSDVEMPRLNGFELVSRLRTRPQWQELPVVLVTGLDSRENKERGLSVGANGYLSKKDFDPDKLLSLVGQLI